jgi:Spy/CpxP family protein refolding chaperone
MLKKIIIILVFLTAFVFAVQAQEDTSSIGSRKKLHKAVKEKFMQKLNIDEATANKFFELYGEQKKEMKEFEKSKRQLMQSIEENPESSDVMTKIDQILDIDEKICKSRRDFITSLQKFLTPGQIAQSIIFQKNLKKLYIKNGDRKEHH